jgi:hypothetical protein
MRSLICLPVFPKRRQPSYFFVAYGPQNLAKLQIPPQDRRKLLNPRARGSTYTEEQEHWKIVRRDIWYTLYVINQFLYRHFTPIIMFSTQMVVLL